VTPVCSNRWVPITMSTEPSFMPSSTARDSVESVNRDNPLTVTGKPHPLGERLQVLIGQQRRRHQHRHLLAVLHRLERRAHRDLVFP